MADLIEDIVALLHPMPFSPANAVDVEQEAIAWQREQIIRERKDTDARLRRLWDQTDIDPLLHVLDEQRRIRDEVEARIRHVVAYAREFVAPRPYPLEALAPSLGVSPSAVRGSYDHRDVEQVAEVTGRRSTVTQTPADPATQERLVDELAARTKPESAQAQVHAVAAALARHGWTPYAPVRRTPNPRFAKHYVRWEQRWPYGTVVSLYQEPDGWLGVHAKMPEDDPRWFNEQYGARDEDGEMVTASDIFDALTVYGARVTRYDETKAH